MYPALPLIQEERLSREKVEGRRSVVYEKEALGRQFLTLT